MFELNTSGITVSVTGKFEKKDSPLTIKVGESLKREIESIASNEDRPVGYVIRELMVRGLDLYRADGLLRSSTNTTRSKGVPATTIKLGQKIERKKAG